MEACDHTRWWYTKKKSAPPVSGKDPSPLMSSYMNHFEGGIMSAQLAEMVKFFVHEELQHINRSESLKAPCLREGLEADQEEQGLNVSGGSSELDMQEVNLDSFSSEDTQPVANVKKFEADLAKSLQIRQQLEEEVKMLKREIKKHLSQIKVLGKRLAESSEKQKRLENEVKILKFPVAPSNASVKDDDPLFCMLREALSAVQSALHVCVVELTVKMKSFLGKDLKSISIHRQLCHSFFLDFESTSFGGMSCVDPQNSNTQMPDHDKKTLLLEYMDLQKESAEVLFTFPCASFKAFYASRFNVFAGNRGDFAPFQNPDLRKAFLARLLQHEQSPLFADLAQLAKTVWLLHKLAFACEPPAAIFRVNEGVRYHPEYMESLAESGDPKGDEEVAFMAAPGFTFKNLVLKAQVQLKR